VSGVALSLEEREEIRAGLVGGASLSAVARGLGRAPSTVTREVRRNGGRDRYRAVSAQQRADRCRSRPKLHKLVAEPSLARVVTRHLRAGYSPAGIAALLRCGGGGRVCHETIYRALYSPVFVGLGLRAHDCLRSRRRRRQRRGTPRANWPGPVGGQGDQADRSAAGDSR